MRKIPQPAPIIDSKEYLDAKKVLAAYLGKNEKVEISGKITEDNLKKLLETRVVECACMDCKYNKMTYPWVHKEDRAVRCMFQNIAIDKDHKCLNFVQKENKE